ncbi:MAG: cysteine desulfurase [Marinobacter nauticus]|jgi:cysteine desulfurase/selenocysteine lyase|uniref:aminotransferase class V-fold PLP-dependent enzyme n=1 Tax=Marinobacter TaxID=2742 RepID=UPI000C9341DE|nr:MULTISPECIES: cysteine desulfurase [Marinobacter]MAC22090.1 cysteine desulfurase CsdA [Marinobacter sp.]MBY6192371.1 cysteine desulfurase [Marinobacter nauticus]MBY6213519.1 cysteine desulfurase [Marinobacter nauticus]MCS5562086.1 cysteine desulfurase [Marinobacter nauticus]HCL39690.1 cysteine desulfurase CsdA [Marinobacter nauticus]|tara:strand:+ start:1875 stop:3128 length:1254 start_codon:yes stop_codon:yes gene_type:complete
MTDLSMANNTQSMVFDVQAIRRDFPILNQEINGKPLVYLDNGASAQKPQSVLDAMDRYYREMHSNVHRGAHTLGDRATAAFEGARETVRQFLNASSTREIIWTRGTTEAINLVANGLAPRLKAGDEILVSHMEHHANIVPWQMVAERTGARVVPIQVTPQGELDLDSFNSLLNERTRVLAITHVSNALGTVNPIAPLIEQAKKQGVLTLVDGAQAVPHFQPDVQSLGCDFYAFSSHKLFGPTGIGVLYGRAELLEEMPPYQGGGEMIERVSFERTTWNVLPYKFEAGTPAIAEAVGLGAAIDYLNSLNRKAMEAAEDALLRRANELVETVPGMEIIGTAANKVPVMSFKIAGLHPSDIGTLLDQQGIAIRTGHHCAMPLMDFYGVPGTARASFAFYNTLEEVEKLFTGLQKIQRLFA